MSVPSSGITSFPVSYGMGSTYNRDLAGTGSVDAGAGVFIFRGKRRGILLSGTPTEITLRSDQVRNVTVQGPRVQFTTDFGSSGEKKQPFVFFCRTPVEAAAIARLLPSGHDEEFVQSQVFAARLRQLAAAGGGTVSVTNVLIAANVLVYVVMGFLGAGWFEPGSMKPYMLFAANNGAATTNGEWWRLVTSMFVHYGLFHILFNMVALYQVGPLVERLLGRRQYALTYFSSGVIGSLATIVRHGDKIWSAGASGAIFGVYGALLGYLVREKQRMPRSVLQPLMKSTLLFAGYNLLYGAINPHIDNMAHIGGVVSGFCLGWICALPLDPEVRRRSIPRRLLLAAALSAGAIAVGVKAAPRFDYNPRDEILLSDALSRRAERQQELAHAEQSLMTASRRGVPDPGLRDWIENTAIPFYNKWDLEIESLRLTPGLRTVRRRDAIHRIFRMEVTGYRDLSDALERGDPSGWDRFWNRRKEINGATLALTQG